MQFPIRVFFKNNHLDFLNEESFSQYFVNYSIINAAGGIVINKEREVLMIFRRNKWDFPKGKIEEGESPELAAMREVAEETGIRDFCISKQLPSTFHTYELCGQLILKETYWFVMHNQGNEKLIPQTEEDISLAEWVPKSMVDINLANSYPSLKSLWEHIEL